MQNPRTGKNAAFKPAALAAIVGLFLGLVVITAPVADLRAAPLADNEIWLDLKETVFDGKPIETKTGLIEMEAPYRAHDAALVPLTIKAPYPAPGQHYKSLTLIIDNNPVPVAAVFDLSPKLGQLHLETRVRIDQYSHVRAILETSDGKLHMVTKYVKASGGCSAPSMKDMDAKMAQLGKSKLRQFSPASDKQSKIPQREVQVMVRHPNYSGMQMNQATGYYIPAHYVNEIVITLDGEQLMKVEGAISISEDPVIRFRFPVTGKEPKLGLKVKDTKNKTFINEWQLKPIEQSGS